MVDQKLRAEARAEAEENTAALLALVASMDDGEEDE